MSRLIKQRERVRESVTRHEYVFSHDPAQAGIFPPRGGWYGFKCDAAGTVDRASLAPLARHNFDYCCLMRPWGFVAEYQERHEYDDPGLIQCDCGCEVEVYDWRDVECERCHREYNSAGQLLAPRSQWGEETGECAADYDFGCNHPERAFDE